MTFTTSKLVGSRVLVKGTDSAGTSGEVVLNSTQWDEVNANSMFKQAESDFDRAVEDFFAPLTAATAAVNKALHKPRNPLAYVVLQEGSPGVAPVQEQLIHLDHDSQVLRLIETGNDERLVWVDGGLEILEVDDELPFEEPVAGGDSDEFAPVSD